MIRKYSDEELKKAVMFSKSVADVLRYLGIRVTGGSHSHITNRIKAANISTAHFLGSAHNRGNISRNRKKPEEILILRASSGIRQHAYILKRALLEIGRPYKCGVCGISNWLDKELVLSIDHINGNFCDDRPDNVRFMCPNCHSQTETYGSKVRV